MRPRQRRPMSAWEHCKAPRIVHFEVRTRPSSMSFNQHQTVEFKGRLRERAAQLRGEIQRTLERSSDESHVRIAEQARDTEDDSFSNLIVDLNLAEIDRDADGVATHRYGADAPDKRNLRRLHRLRPDRFPCARLKAEPTASRCVHVPGAVRKDARDGEYAAALERREQRVSRMTGDRSGARRRRRRGSPQTFLSIP